MADPARVQLLVQAIGFPATLAEIRGSRAYRAVDAFLDANPDFVFSEAGKAELIAVLVAQGIPVPGAEVVPTPVTPATPEQLNAALQGAAGGFAGAVPAPAGGVASNEDIASLFNQQHPGFEITSFLPGGGVLATNQTTDEEATFSFSPETGFTGTPVAPIRGFAPPSPGAGNTILQPGQTLVGPNGETLRALPPDPQFGQTFQNERTGEVFRTQNGQLVPVPELTGFAGIAPERSFQEQARQFGITQQGLNQRNALSNAPGFLNAATAINQQQQSILNSGGDVVLRRFLAAGEQPPAGLQTFNQADQLRGFNLPGLLNQFGGLTQSLGFGAPGAGFGAPPPAPAPTAAPAGGGFPPEVQSVIDKAARDAAITNALAASQAEFDAAAAPAPAPIAAPTTAPAPAPTTFATTFEEDPEFQRLFAEGFPGFAHGGFSDDVAVVGEKGPELVSAMPGGGFAVIPFEGKPPKGVKRAQFGGLFGFPQAPDVSQTELQGFARETAFPNVRRVFQQGLAPRADQFSFALPTFRGLQGLSPDDRANAETALRLGAFGGKGTTFTDVEAAVRERFLPSQGRGRARLAGF